jgi:hypothetical protein
LQRAIGEGGQRATSPLVELLRPWGSVHLLHTVTDARAADLFRTCLTE